MPILTVKCLAANSASALNAAIAEYVEGDGDELATSHRGMDVASFLDKQSDKNRHFAVLAHGGVDVPAVKTADLKLITLEASSLADMQDRVDAALADVPHKSDATGDTSVANRVMVDTAAFFAETDVGRKISVDGVERVISAVLGYAATGTITAIAGAAIVDDKSFVLDDGDNPPVTFTFDDDASVTPSATLRAIVFTALDDVATVKAAIIAAINEAFEDEDLTIEATPGAGAVINLTNTVLGAAGNEDITEDGVGTGFEVSGMAGGIDLGVTAEYAGAALDADTGLDVVLFGAEAIQDVEANVFRERDGDPHYVVMLAVEGQLA